MDKVYIIKDLNSSYPYFINDSRGSWDSDITNAMEFKTQQEAIDKINELKIPYTIIVEIFINKEEV